MKVIVTRRLPDSVEARLAERFDSELNPADSPFDRARLADAMARCDALAPTVTDRIDSGLIEGAGERLRLIASFGAGTDHVDLDAARARGIAVTNTPGVLTEDTADLVIALVLMTARRLGEGERTLRGGRWRGWGPTDQLGRSLAGRALGIVGMGRIGQAVARRAEAFGMTVHYHNRRPVTGARQRYWPELDAMLAAMDMVSLNAPYAPATHHLIDRRRLGLMRPDAWLINAARGRLVDEEALIEALAGGRLAGAGLDVYPDEPNVDARLLALPNVVLCPTSARRRSRAAPRWARRCWRTSSPSRKGGNCRTGWPSCSQARPGPSRTDRRTGTRPSPETALNPPLKSGRPAASRSERSRSNRRGRS